MGFLKTNGGQYDGINYVNGKPTTVKFNAKKGIFQQLGNNFGETQMTVSVLKEVNLPELILFPHEGKIEKATPKEHIVLMFLDPETNDVCTGLVKTYSEGAYRKLKGEIAAYNRENNTEYDVSDFNITMTWKELPSDAKADWFIEFTFCKNKKGKPCRYQIVDGSKLEVNEDAVADVLSKEDYARNYDFFQKTDNGNLIYDLRLGKEILKCNFDEKTIPARQKNEYTYYVMGRYGFFNMETAQTLIGEKTAMLTALPATA